MGWFFKSKDNVLDLSERYRKQQERLKELKEESTQESSSSEAPAGGFGIFGMSSTTTTTTSSDSDSGYASVGDADEKRRKLAKRLMDITDKIEDLSNQIYHIQQRLEVLEKRGSSSVYP